MTFQNFLIPLINKSTRVTKANATLTNDFLDTASSTGIVKSGITHHFQIFLTTSAQYLENIQNEASISNEK